MRRLIGAVVIIIGAGAFAACLRAALVAARDVMVKDGGFCASGGPYVIAHQCTSGDMRLLLVGILGGLVAVAVYAIGTATLSWSAPSAGLSCWVAGFGAFGWSFISVYLTPPTGQSGSGGFLISGIVFEALAVGGLAPLLTGLVSELRPRATPSSSSRRIGPPIVQAVIPPGMGPASPSAFGGVSAYGTTALGVTGSPVDAVPSRVPPSVFASVGIWLVTSVVGAVIGLILSSSLVSALK